MAEAEYSTTAKLPLDAIWDFVKEMDNWAAFVTGYQSHEKQSETDSVWVLKGDVGVLTRTLEFQVHITEWNGPERVRFTLKGVNEALEGEGTFTMAAFEDENAAPAASPDAGKKGSVARILEAISRFFYRLVHGRVERSASADSGPGEGVSKMTFQLRLDPGGPMAPMINAMIKPLLFPAAEDLANKIMATLESRRDGNA